MAVVSGSAHQSRPVQPTDFKRWRKSLRLSQKEAAKALGLKRRMVQYYEKGERDGDKVEVPKAVRLACYALASGVDDYHGPDHDATLPATSSAEPDAGALPISQTSTKP